MRLAFGVSWSTLGDDGQSFNIGLCLSTADRRVEDEKVEREVLLLGVGVEAADDEGEEFDDVGGVVLDVLDDGGWM